MAKSCDAGSKCSAHVGVYKGKLCRLIEVLVVHVMNKIKGIYVNVSKPFHHIHKLRHELFIGNYVAFDWAICRTTLLTCLVVYTATDGVSKALCKVGTCSEELHFLTCLCGRHTAAD